MSVQLPSHVAIGHRLLAAHSEPYDLRPFLFDLWGGGVGGGVAPTARIHGPLPPGVRNLRMRTPIEIEIASKKWYVYGCMRCSALQSSVTKACCLISF